MENKGVYDIEHQLLYTCPNAHNPIIWVLQYNTAVPHELNFKVKFPYISKLRHVKLLLTEAESDPPVEQELTSVHQAPR